MIRFRDLKTKNKVMIGVCAPLALTAILGAAAAYSISSIQHSAKWVDHTHKVISQATAIVASAVDMETGMRGYLLAGKEEFLEPYNSGSGKTYEQTAALKQTVSDNPPQVDRLAEIEDLLKAWQAGVTEPTIELRRQIGDAPTMNDMAKLVGEARGKIYFDKFRGQIAQFISREQELLVERNNEFKASLVSVDQANKTLADSSAWVEHTYRVLGQASQILGSVVDIETGMRGFLLAGDDEFLEPYIGGQEFFKKAIAELQQTVSDNPPQVARLQQAESLISDWIRTVTEPAIALRRDVLGGRATLADVEAFVGRKLGKQYVDGFRTMIAEFSAIEQELIVQRRADAAAASAQVAEQLTTLEKNERWVAHTHKVIEQAKDILAAAVDMETGMRGYLLAGKEEFLEPYKSGSDGFYILLENLQSTVSDNPPQVELLAATASTIREWQANVTEPTITLRADIGDAKTMDDMADLVGEARGKTYFDEFRSLIGEFIAIEAELMEVRKADSEQTVTLAYTVIIACIVLGTALGISFALFVGRNIAGPLVKMTSMMRGLASGDTSAPVPGGDRKDEIGEMAGAVEVFKANTIKLGRMSKELEDGIGASVIDLLETCEKLDTNAKEIAKITNETVQNGSNVAAAVEEMSVSIRTVASGSGQLAGSISEISEQVNLSTNMAKEATSKASSARDSVENLLSEADQVESVVAMISDIAEQTNLLALNATIESARAGDAGKGFAVVAQEVKTLASQTSIATDKIAQQMRSIQTRCKSVADEVTDIGGSIAKIDEVSSAIAGAVVEQDSSTNEIAGNTEESAKAASEISANINQVQKQMAVAGNNGQELGQMARDVSDKTEKVQVALNRFIDELAA